MRRKKKRKKPETNKIGQFYSRYIYDGIYRYYERKKERERHKT
jgi:hypothetical protein